MLTRMLFFIGLFLLVLALMGLVSISTLSFPSPRQEIEENVSEEKLVPPISPTSTATFTLTDTPSPTTTPTATATLTPPPEPDAVVNVEALNLRSGPGTVYDVMERLKKGDSLEVAGKNLAGDWLKVIAPSEKEGWVATSYLELNIPLVSVAVVQAPPTPTYVSPLVVVTATPAPPIAAPLTPAIPSVPLQWVGYVITTTTQHVSSGAVLRVSVIGQKDLPVTVSSGTWSITGLTGTKPEYGEYVCEFAPLGAGTFTITPKGLGVSLDVELDGTGVTYVEFRQRPVMFPPPSMLSTETPAPMPPISASPTAVPLPTATSTPTATLAPSIYTPTPTATLVPSTPTSTLQLTPSLTPAPLPTVMIEAEWTRKMEVNCSDSIRISLKRIKEQPFTPTIEIIGHTVIAVTPTPFGTPGPPEGAWGPEYKASAIASLAGTAFKVSPVITEYQSLEQTEIKWVWNIMPEKPGPQIINASIQVKWEPIGGDGETIHRQIWDHRLEIFVEKPLIATGQLNTFSLFSGFVGSALSVPWLYERIDERIKERREKRQKDKESKPKIHLP